MLQRSQLLTHRSGDAPARRRVKTPTVLQLEAVECGAAALAMVLAYYGRIVPLAELRLACGVSRDGIKASNILKAAQTYGLVGKGYRKEPEQLPMLRLPCIVFWNLNHFVVVEGFDKHKVYLNDPALGRRTVSNEEFDHSFTGVVLTLEPGPHFERGGKQRGIVPALRSRLRGAGPALWYVTLASLLVVLLGLFVPLFTRVFVDYYLVRGLGGLLGPLFAGLVLTAILLGIVTWLQQKHLLQLETHLALTSTATFFWHVLRLPVEFFSQRYAGDISARVAINDRVARLLAGDAPITLLSVALAITYMALMLRYDVILTLVAVLIAALNLVVLRFVARTINDQNQLLQQEHAKLVGTAYHGLETIESIKASGSESDFFARWAGFQAKLHNAEQKLGTTIELLGAIPRLLTLFSTVAVLTLGGWRVMNGQLTIGMLATFYLLLLALMVPINQLVSVAEKLQAAGADLNRLDDVLRYPVQVSTTALTAADVMDSATPQLGGHLQLNSVTFGYSRLERPLLEDFNLTLSPGSRVALVGGSGSGKSTVAKLVAGLYEPWSGTVLFDGQPRAALPPALLQNSVAVVDQDIFLFQGTIRDNLTLWDATIPDVRLQQATQDALIHGEISNRPGGYSYVLDEGGHDLSGGQRQRLEIARALVLNPTILVLDEATSALDPVTEQAIDNNIRRRGCTCLIVAHRLSTIRDCDEIVVLEQGKVIERGTHEQLMRSGGLYMQLIRADEPLVMEAAEETPPHGN